MPRELDLARDVGVADALGFRSSMWPSATPNSALVEESSPKSEENAAPLSEKAFGNAAKPPPLLFISTTNESVPTLET